MFHTGSTKPNDPTLGLNYYIFTKHQEDVRKLLLCYKKEFEIMNVKKGSVMDSTFIHGRKQMTDIYKFS